MQHTERGGLSAGLWTTCTLLRRVCKVSVCLEIWVRCLSCQDLLPFTRCVSFVDYDHVIALSGVWLFWRSVRLTRTRDYVRCPHFRTNAFFCLYILPAARSKESLDQFWIGRFIRSAVSMVRCRARAGLSKVEWYIPSTLFHRIYFHVTCGYSAMRGSSTVLAICT